MLATNQGAMRDMCKCSIAESIICILLHLSNHIDYNNSDISKLSLVRLTKSCVNIKLSFINTHMLFILEGSSDCFQCSDGTMCIDQALVCNDVPNCNDDSDELEGTCKDGMYNKAMGNSI